MSEVFNWISLCLEKKNRLIITSIKSIEEEAFCSHYVWHVLVCFLFSFNEMKTLSIEQIPAIFHRAPQLIKKYSSSDPEDLFHWRQMMRKLIFNTSSTHFVWPSTCNFDECYTPSFTFAHVPTMSSWKFTLCLFFYYSHIFALEEKKSLSSRPEKKAKRKSFSVLFTQLFPAQKKKLSE